MDEQSGARERDRQRLVGEQSVESLAQPSLHRSPRRRAPHPGHRQPWGTAAPEGDWVVGKDALPAIVPKDLFDAVQRKLARARICVSRADALDDVRRVARARGTLSQHALNKHGLWSAGLYIRRLGPIEKIRSLIGMPDNNHGPGHTNLRTGVLGRVYTYDQLLGGLRCVLARHGYLNLAIINAAGETACEASYRRRFGSMSEAYRRIGYKPSAAQRRFITVAVSRFQHLDPP